MARISPSHHIPLFTLPLLILLLNAPANTVLLSYHAPLCVVGNGEDGDFWETTKRRSLSTYLCDSSKAVMGAMKVVVTRTKEEEKNEAEKEIEKWLRE